MDRSEPELLLGFEIGKDQGNEALFLNGVIRLASSAGQKKLFFGFC
jgi:hypothetical protein